MKKRTVFIISDHTGLTAQSLARSLMSQFPDYEFDTQLYSFMDSTEKANRLRLKINDIIEKSSDTPIIFATIVRSEIREIVSQCNCIFMDLFDAFINPLENVLETKSSHKMGLFHGISDQSNYFNRINAMNFALESDDGMRLEHYEEAQIIIVGVSRSGKTPTCLYLAIQHGVYTANYPLTGDELSNLDLPPALSMHREKIVGLTIDPYRLQHIRRERYNRDSYSSAKQCEHEVSRAEAIFRKHKIPILNSTQMSVEELGAKIIQQKISPHALKNSAK